MPDFLVEFDPDGRQAYISEQDNLLQAIAAAGIPLKASCGGKGTCNRCKTLVRAGKVKSAASGKLTEAELAAGYVLACQSTPESDLVLEVPEESRLSEHRVVLDGLPAGESNAILPEDEGLCKDGECDPLFKKIVVRVPGPTLEEAEDDLGRLFRVLRKQIGADHLRADLETMRSLPAVLRQSGWQVAVSLTEARGYKAVGVEEVEPDSLARKYYGLAIDIGTTTVVVHLVDLETGVSLGVKGTYNRQAIYGDDVISRIIHAVENKDGLRELQKAVLATINELTADLLREHDLKATDVRVAVCAGNTTMTHLFLGLDPAYIRLEPYTPAANSIPALRAHRVGLKIYPQAWVQCLPGIASYVGGDITAGVLVTGMAFSDQMTLFIDIGTNGEMVLGNKEWLISCACSAGPAFEGGGVRHGMRAMRGAIEHVRIAPGGMVVDFTTVDSAPPVGICGSGLIDCIAGLYSAGVIDRSGNILPGLKTPRVRESDEGMEFVLAWSHQSGRKVDITISEAEIKNLIRSKAAVFAGVNSMLKMVGLPLDAIERVIIAGGFGRYINIKDAVGIGLLPDLPLEKYTYIGNSSVKGAKMVLMFRRAREEVEEIARKMTYLELSAGNTFMEEFVSALFIPHTDLSLFPSLQLQ